MTTDKQPGAVAVKAGGLVTQALCEALDFDCSAPAAAETTKSVAAIIQSAINEEVAAVEAERDDLRKAYEHWIRQASKRGQERDEARAAAGDLWAALGRALDRIPETAPAWTEGTQVAAKHAAYQPSDERKAGE